ncbi:DNA-directed RNA polymerase, mitochondrial [Trichosurus vulpecula]|uniref:DNA-directed RNA polymerase, mitochondrial n=1 Tax=Trichosurus vulpecula TaxID=9337 RepID=UPI00186B0E4E|nr:DNA-directed RNA polymerase, mitochondrial [Trichosurus vulpecula]
MSVLRLRASLLSRGAAGLGGALRPEGSSCPSPEKGAWWTRGRRYSVNVPERDRRRDAGQVELLEVLEARVRQLQNEYVSEVTVNRVEVAPRKPVSQKDLQALELVEDRVKGDASSAATEAGKASLRWMERLTEERNEMHRRQQILESKLKKVTFCESQIKRREKEFLARKLKGNKQTPNIGKEKAVVGRETPHHSKKQESFKALKVQKENKTSVDDLDSSRLMPEVSRHSKKQLLILDYLECLLSQDLVTQANHLLLSYFHRPGSQKLLTLPMYNSVLKAWAKQGSLHQISTLFSMMNKSGLTPDLVSYASVLECMCRANADFKIIKSCLNQMAKDGLHLKNLFHEVALHRQERMMVLKAIQKVEPGFSPPPASSRKIAISPLLRDFYSKEEPASYPKLPLSLLELQKRFQQQLKLESAMTITIDSVEKKPLTNQNHHARKLLKDLKSQWQEALLKTFRETKVHMSQLHPQINLYPYLCLLKDTDYVDLMMQTLLNLPPHGDSLIHLVTSLAMKVQEKNLIQKKMKPFVLDELKRKYMNYLHLLAKDTQLDSCLPREHWESLESEATICSDFFTQEKAWPEMVLVRLGAQLVEIMVQSVHVPSNLFSSQAEKKLIPVLYHVYSFLSIKQVGFIKPHPTFSQLLAEAACTELTFDSSVMPMLCPPKPWTSPLFGAYVLHPTKLMRCLEGTFQHQELLESCPQEHLYPVLDALNLLGNCAWKVNQPVLDLIISVFNAKGSKKLDVPPPVSEAPTPPSYQLSKDISSSEKAKLRREIAQCHKTAREMYSLRMDALYKLSIAHHLRDQIFWFPHNMDFRGRAYPCPPHFNHLGSDLTRAILLFAEGKPLGPKGLDWLKIHLINLTGLKKREPLQARLAYANEILEDILDSADNPITGKKWWMDVDEPWQTLACCMEIANAVRSPDPEAYISHFPVHQDGSCNGLQHYAALGRDVTGAISVNLMPCDVPQDVYSGVAQLVEEQRRKDAASGRSIAQALEGFIGRKLVKQTVMTVVYGVTRYGGRLQIEKRLKELDDFPKEYVWEASTYLSQLVFSSLSEMFSATREIQDWLTKSAYFISKSGSTVQWVTPLGLPVIQPYHKTQKIIVPGNLQSLCLLSYTDVNQKPNTLKQKNAFPPNFIHSLDSTHMMLTALYCHRKGLTFVSVHDCFWTHASTVDLMNEICREQFVNLHSQPILQELSQYLVQKYCSKLQSHDSSKEKSVNEKLLRMLSHVPERGNFDLQNVKNSTYFFS